MKKKVGESWFKKYIWIALACFLAATAYLGYHATHLRFDYDFEKFFPDDDEDTRFFYAHRDKFQSENDYLLIAIEREAGVFDSTFLQKVARFTSELETIDNVEYINSITNLQEIFLFPGGATDAKPYIDFQDFNPKRDSSRIFSKEELINSMVAENGKSIALFLKHTDYLSKKKSDALIDQVKALGDSYAFEKLRIAGRTVGQQYYIAKMTNEIVLFLGLSAILIVLFLFIAFRSAWGVLVPQVIMVGSMVWVIGGMAYFDVPVNIILTVLPTIIFVVSMSDVIHLVSRYLDALRTEETVFEAIKLAVKEVGFATFLTSVTTSIGFFSLIFVKVQPVQSFGIVMGIGVLVAFVLTFLILPALFYLFPGPKYVRTSRKDHFWKPFLMRAFIWVTNRRKGVFVVAIAMVVVSILGMIQLKTDNLLMDDMRASEPLKQDFNFLDTEFGGIRPFELAVTLKDTNYTAWSPEVIRQLDTVERYLEEDYGVEIHTSLIQTLKVLNRASNAGNSDYFDVPESNRKLKTFRRSIRIANGGDFVKTLMDSTERTLRVSGTIPDLGNLAISEKNDALMAFVKQHDLGGNIEFRVTGTAHLVDKNLKYLSLSLIQGLSLSVLIVAVIIGLIYRSFIVALISVVTNVIPLLCIAGIMGYWGVELRTSTSIIFTIAFGIAVDDTIHYLGKFKYELMKGRGKLYALKRSYLTTGKAMILTTLILCAGFLLLMFSGFLGTFYLGVLLSITLFVALIADLTLLPVLLLVFYKDKQTDRRKN